MEANEAECVSKKEKEGSKHKKRRPTALTIQCGVCLGPAPDHLHFGARCCYSCRAFFRRTAPRSDSLVCRSSLGTCEISTKNKKCIACRYEKCLSIGMAPQLVQGRRNKHTEDHLDAEDHQHDTETQRVADELLDSTQASLPMETTEEQESNCQPLTNISSALSTMASYGGNYQKPNAQQKEATLVSAQYGSTYASHSLQKEAEPSMFRNYQAFPKSLYKTNYVNPLSFPAPFPPQYRGPSESEKQSCSQETDCNKRQMMRSAEQYQQSKHNAQYAGVYKENLLKKEPSDMAPILNNLYGHSHQSKDSKPAMQEGAYQRTSVIKSMSSLKRKSPDELQYEADILKYQGSILMHTGNLFNYHANLLERERSGGENKTVICKPEPMLTQVKLKEEIKIEDSRNEIKNEYFTSNFKQFPVKESESPQNILSEELADQMFLEAQDLLLHSPWITNINISEEKEDLAEKEGEREGSTLNEITVPLFNKYNTDVDNITDIQFTSDDLASDTITEQNDSLPKTSDCTSVIQNYGLSMQVKK